MPHQRLPPNYIKSYHQMTPNQQQQQQLYNGSSSSPSMFIVKCTDVPQFDALLAQADLFSMDDKLHLRNLCNDTARCASLIAIHNSRAGFKEASNVGRKRNPTHNNSTHHKMILDYSRQRVTGETMEQLFDLADAVGLAERCWSFKEGAPINATEGKPVLHHVLRMPAYYQLELSEAAATTATASEESFLQGGGGSAAAAAAVSAAVDNGNNWGQEPTLSNVTAAEPPTQLDGRFVLQEVHNMRSRIQDFCFRVRSGDYVSVTGQHIFKNVLVIAKGGNRLGTECVAEALRADPEAAERAGPNRCLRFVTHADPVNVHLACQDLLPVETLLIIISKTFATGDNPVMLNARTAMEWLVKGIQQSRKSISAESIYAKHLLAITQDHPSSIKRCRGLGVAISNVFAIPTWVSPRYSLCSAVGLLPLSLQYSYPIMADFLDGAHDIDEHFFHAPLRENIPVILGLLGVWNSTFLGYNCRAILPYSYALHRFPAYIQHVDMESNGKRVALDGTPLLHRSGEVDFGEADGQYSFSQLLHQGRVVPVDFIGFMENQQPVDLPGEAVSNHDDLMCHFFAQPDALAYGKTLVDLGQEGTAEPLRQHMAYSGNRPSSSLLMTRLDAYTMGQLIALYEHRTAVQGFIWGINSFDQFGLELGSVLAKPVRAQLSASRKTGASVQGFNSSTSSLLEHYLANEQQQFKKVSISPDNQSL